MWDMFTNSLRLFLKGKLFREQIGRASCRERV